MNAQPIQDVNDRKPWSEMDLFDLRNSLAYGRIRGHTKAALRHGVTRQELMEAIWVAAEMRAGAAYAHSTIAVTAIDEAEGLPPL